MMENELKVGFVTILGLPNAGKSTFLNAVLSENIAITSRKPQTTRKNLKGIYNDDNSQIIFIDTPGVHSAKNKLDDYMNKSINKSLEDIDVLLLIVDIVTYKEDNFDNIKKLVAKMKCPKILLFNKIDVNVEEKVSFADEDISNIFSGIVFDKIFYISSLKKKNIKEVINEIKKHLPVGNKFYDEEYITDTPMKQIVADIIRQQCLYKLNKEVPHGVTVVIDSYKKSKTGCRNIEAAIICERESHKGIIIGKGGQMIKNIGTAARIAIEKMTDEKVNLKLQVLVKDNWRDEKTLLANYGFDEKAL